MVIYEITASVDQSRVEAYEKYMWEEHIPDLMATGHFARAEFTRGEGGAYRMRYLAHGRLDLENYLKNDAERLRADFAKNFPSGVEVTRTVWDVLETWPAQAAEVGSY